MIAPPPRPQFRLGTYNNGQPYVVPRGRYAPRGRVEDRLRLAPMMRTSIFFPASAPVGTFRLARCVA